MYIARLNQIRQAQKLDIFKWQASACGSSRNWLYSWGSLLMSFLGNFIAKHWPELLIQIALLDSVGMNSKIRTEQQVQSCSLCIFVSTCLGILQRMGMVNKVMNQKIEIVFFCREMIPGSIIKIQSEDYFLILSDIVFMIKMILKNLRLDPLLSISYVKVQFQLFVIYTLKPYILDSR